MQISPAKPILFSPMYFTGTLSSNCQFVFNKSDNFSVLNMYHALLYFTGTFSSNCQFVFNKSDNFSVLNMYPNFPCVMLF